MPDLKNVNDFITLPHSFLQFSGNLSTLHGTVLIGMFTVCLLKGVSTGAAQWEEQFALGSIWKDRLIQLPRRDYFAFYQSLIPANVGGKVLR